jgi:hypothetical protein
MMVDAPEGMGSLKLHNCLLLTLNKTSFKGSIGDLKMKQEVCVSRVKLR